MQQENHYDVAIVGGGPSGATVGTLLKKYRPSLNVSILERETFPRDHIGESLLPPIGPILEELGVWDRVEAANFPIKVGATYRWGRNPELWDFDFLVSETFVEESRPAKFEGQRKKTAFQVERSIYDQILLDRAAELGCVVRQNTGVAEVLVEKRRIQGLVLESGEVVRATHYVDASGSAALLRKALQVPIEEPTTLRNIAIWDYWQNADWAVEIGVGGTRIQVMSLGWGWLWFIPMGPTRTSIGLVVPAAYYKESGLRPAEIYAKALAEEPLISSLLKNATSENKLTATKDWSHLANRHYGPNWFLVGECAGFADPILSAGVTMAQISARELAYTIAEIDRGELDAYWLRQQFEHGQRERILTHIRFGDYWYTANAQFRDLQNFTAELAKDAGLDLTPEKAWAWLAQGGFITQDLRIGAGGFTLTATRKVGEFLSDLDVEFAVERNNVFRLNLKDAARNDVAVYYQGRIHKESAYIRGDRTLPLFSQVLMVVEMLQKECRLPHFMRMLEELAQKDAFVAATYPDVLDTLEALVSDGWVTATYDPRLPLVVRNRESRTIKWNTDRAD